MKSKTLKQFKVMKSKTLKQFKAGLDQFIKENPEAMDLQVAVGKDDEGNGFDAVLYDISIMTVELNNYGNEEAKVVCLN